MSLIKGTDNEEAQGLKLKNTYSCAATHEQKFRSNDVCTYFLEAIKFALVAVLLVRSSLRVLQK